MASPWTTRGTKEYKKSRKGETETSDDFVLYKFSNLFPQTFRIMISKTEKVPVQPAIPTLFVEKHILISKSIHVIYVC